MFVTSFVFAIVIAYATAEVPDYIQVCGRRNPKIEQCILNSVENLRSKICDGIPELDVPSINPMTFKDINFIDTPSMKVYLKRVNTSGLCNFNVTYLRGDPIKLHYDIELKMNHVIFDIDYDFNIRLLVPIEHKGLLNLYLDDVLARATVDFATATKNGKKHVYMSKMKLNIDVNDKSVHYKINEDRADQLLVIVNNFIGQNTQELIDTLKPFMEEHFIKQIFLLSNNIVKHFTYDELFPDRL